MSSQRDEATAFSKMINIDDGFIFLLFWKYKHISHRQTNEVHIQVVHDH